MTFEAVLRAPLRSAAFRFAVLLALIWILCIIGLNLIQTYAV